MAWSAHKSKNALKEHHSTEDILDKQCAELALLIQNSRYFVVFTGAGISTSAGIPDFRGPNGVWTLEAEGRQRDNEQVDSEKAVPSAGHMALLTLQQNSKLHFVISQNCDGLHRRSGLPPDCLAELHGNTNLEHCKSCGKEYFRDYWVPKETQSISHKTDRKCECGKWLYDNIIHFGEDLPATAFERASEASKRSDLFLVLGSSLTVTPANELPELARANGAKLVICNLQKTPLDKNADLRIFGSIDNVLGKTMRPMQPSLTIQWWMLQRRVRIVVLGPKITIQALEPDGTPIIVKRGKFQQLKQDEPYKFEIGSNSKNIKLEFHFIGNFNEPALNFSVSPMKNSDELNVLFLLSFIPSSGKWLTPCVTPF